MTEMCALLGTALEELYSHDYLEADDRVARMPESMRANLAAVICKSLQNPAMLPGERARVVTARFAVALWPQTIHAIRRVLAFPRRGKVAELQFSLLCCFDIVTTRRHSARERLEATATVEAYLWHATANPRLTSSMAVDTLGSHMPILLALPALKRVAVGAPHRLARRFALDGLEMVRDRVRSSKRRKEIERALRSAANLRETKQTTKAMRSATNRAIGAHDA